MSHAYSENPVNMFQKAEAAPEGGLVTPSTTWWMRCFDATGGRLQRQDSLIGWVFDGYLMEDPFPSFSSLSKLIISRSFPVGRLLVAEKLL
jgi:hypothetical protein